MPERGNSWPQKPQVSASMGDVGEGWKAAAQPESAAHDQECRRRWREFWWRSASFLFLKRLRQYAHSYCFSCSWALDLTLVCGKKEARMLDIHEFFLRIEFFGLLRTTFTQENTVDLGAHIVLQSCNSFRWFPRCDEWSCV